MNKSEFLRRLREDLSSLTEEERLNALKYYEEYFADAGEENEEEIITEFVSPEQVALKIQEAFTEEPPCAPEPPPVEPEVKKEENNYRYENRNDNKYVKPENKTLKMVLLLCTSPFWVPMLIALASVAFGVFMTILGVSLAVAVMALAGFIMAGAGFISIGYGISNIFIDLFKAFYPVGAGFFAVGVGIIIACVFTKLSAGMFKSQFRFAAWVIRGISGKFSRGNA